MFGGGEASGSIGGTYMVVIGRPVLLGSKGSGNRDGSGGG